MSLSFFELNNTTIQRGIEKNCQTCNKQFGVFRKEHQCKRCFRAICSDCGKDRIMIYKHDFARYPHRRCIKCGQEVKQVIEYINSNHLSFGKMSTIGTKWIKKIEKRTCGVLIDDRKHKKFTKEVYDRMWNSYNYTVREFIGMLIFQIDQEDVYRAVYDVLANVISVCPEQQIEGLAYLIIFLLCFCSADKVPTICFYLIELRNTVTDAQGLIQAYFRSLSFSEDLLFKIKDFIVSKDNKYFSSFSINTLSIKSSIYIIDKIITRKKIDQLYMFFCLSIDLIKDIIVQNKNTDANVIDLTMIRNCSIEATSVKYKQVNAVKSMMFIKEKREDDDANSSILSSIEPNFYKQSKKSSLLTNSFTQGIYQNAKEILTFEQIKYEEQMKMKSARPFRKKMTQREDQFPEDSFSMYSMIEQQRDQPKSNQAAETQLLDLLYQVEQKSPNTSIDIKFQKNNHSKGFLLNEDTNQSSHQRQETNGKLKSSQRQFYSQFQNDKTDELVTLDREELKRANKIIQQLKKQNRQLRECLSQKENERGKQNWKEEKNQYENQIKKLKQAVNQYQNKQRQFQLNSMKIQQLKKTIKKQQIDVKSFQQQTEEANLTIKMLKNKLQNQSLASQPIRQISEGHQSAKMMQMMKQSVRQKNQQIQDLTKRNKLLIYQMQQQNKNKFQDQQIIELTKKLKKEERQKAEIIEKMKELSGLLMQEEGEKLNLSQENFALKEYIKSKGISLQNFKY